jgi:hypothetical protein
MSSNAWCSREGVMWGVMVAEDTGEMTLTAGSEKVGFIAFGGCAPE